MRVNFSVSKQLAISSLAFFALIGSGCSSVTKGTTQEIFVETQDVEDAKCTLASDKGAWTVESTPGYVNVARGGGGIKIECTKENYHKAEELVAENFEEMVLGNILIGGLIGIAVDAASGAAFKYPESISIVMRPMLAQSGVNTYTSLPVQNTTPTSTPNPSAIIPSTAPQTTTIAAAPAVSVLSKKFIKKFDGYWQGYAGHGCIHVSGRASEV